MAGPASAVVFAIEAAGLMDSIIFITDGQLSGLCNKGITIAEVSPEGATGGPLGLVENGDVIRIDISKRTLDLVVSEEILEQRRVKFGAPVLKKVSGYLSIYQRLVQPMHKGVTLINSLELKE
jgi:dihydroxy-acid dehydratase